MRQARPKKPSTTAVTSPPRPEYPRPQFRRTAWQNLNGTWCFAFDDEDRGRSQHWERAVPGHNPTPFDRQIIVPFPYQAPLSGIGDRSFHDVCWYARTFDAPSECRPGNRLLLHFGAVDYRASIWLNGEHVAEHEGGHTPFTADISDVVRPLGNTLIVRAEDPSEDLTIPRGKQYWKEQSEHIFYTRTTGIWQTVWLEPVPATRIDRLRLTPDLDNKALHMEVSVAGTRRDASLSATVTRNGSAVATSSIDLEADTTSMDISLLSGGVPLLCWSPEEPNLYDLELDLIDNEGNSLDRVESYFGVRKVEVRGNTVFLNNRPYYQRLVLDQGYFPQGLLAAPSDADLRRDIQLAKSMGFNGARKHQKVEDPRWLFWADRLGFLVWGEMANAYQFSVDYARRMASEWQDVIARDFNHPSIIVWVPINESSGIRASAPAEPEVDHLLGLYHLTRSLDRTRLVLSNEGWEHARSDLCTVHDYADPSELVERYASGESSVDRLPGGRAIYCAGHAYRGEPIVVSEFGGIAFSSGHSGAWGYTTVSDEQQFLDRYNELVSALVQSPAVSGFCYTQLTDVEQEVNGLLTAARTPKADLSRIKAITTQGEIAQSLAA